LDGGLGNTLRGGKFKLRPEKCCNLRIAEESNDILKSSSYCLQALEDYLWRKGKY